MVKKDANKPKGKMSSYAYFVQTCRADHKKSNPGESVGFAEFSKKCSVEWKAKSVKEKRKFEVMAEKDKARYDDEMESYVPPDGVDNNKRKRKTKDPNAPKRPMTSFFFFCKDERPTVRAANPTWSIGLVAKELGKQWENVANKAQYLRSAEKDKARYEKEMAAYNGGGAKASKKVKTPPKAAVVHDDEDDDDDDEEEEDDDEEEEDDDEDDDE